MHFITTAYEMGEDATNTWNNSWSENGHKDDHSCAHFAALNKSPFSRPWRVAARQFYLPVTALQRCRNAPLHRGQRCISTFILLCCLMFIRSSALFRLGSVWGNGMFCMLICDPILTAAARILQKSRLSIFKGLRGKIHTGYECYSIGII